MDDRLITDTELRKLYACKLQLRYHGYIVILNQDEVTSAVVATS